MVCVIYSRPNFKQGIYKCHTELQWGRCGYEGTNVVIHPWKRGDLSSEKPIKAISEAPAKRPLVKKKKKVDVYKRDPKQPLRGMKFALAGHLSKSHADMKNHILEHGGSFSETVAADVTFFFFSLLLVLQSILAKRSTKFG